jgi:SNF2 family DNA or RNA helicase
VIADYDQAQDSFVLSTGLHEGDLAKQVPGAKWAGNQPSHNGAPGAWVARATWPAYVAVNGVFAHTMQATEAYCDWGRRAWEGRYGPLTALRYQQDYALTGPTAERLWPLQRVAVGAMAFAERYAEMDEMGGGKTRTTLATMKLLAAVHGPAEVFPALVVCPNKVRKTWVKEAHDDRDGQGPFWPELRVEVMPKGKPAQRKLLERVAAGEVDVVATNWESLAGLSRLERFGNIEMAPKEVEPGPLNAVPWRTVVADEAHRAKDRRAKQTRALKAVAFGTPAAGTGPARFRYALTGTPVSSNSAEAWSILNFLDEVAWPAYSRLVDRYATTIWNMFGGMEIGGVRPETREEFYQAFEPYGIRRLRQQFDPFRPRVTREDLYVPMEPKQATAYNQLAKEMLAELDGGVLAATSGMHKSNRLHQLAQAYGEMVDKGRRDEEGQAIMDLQLKAPSNKVRAMSELVDEMGIGSSSAEVQPRSIVFGSPSRQLIALCEAELNKKKVPYCLVAGGIGDAEQDRQLADFEARRIRVALCVIQAAKEGLNELVAADTLVFLQESWDRVENEQFVGRVDRPGQQSQSVSVIRVLSEGTLEDFYATQDGESKGEKLADKYANFQEVVADGRTLHRMLGWKGEA